MKGLKKDKAGGGHSHRCWKPSERTHAIFCAKSATDYHRLWGLCDQFLGNLRTSNPSSRMHFLNPNGAQLAFPGQLCFLPRIMQQSRLMVEVR